MFSEAPLHVTKKLMRWKREQFEKGNNMKKVKMAKKRKTKQLTTLKKLREKKRRRRGGRGRDETTVQPRPDSGFNSKKITTSNNRPPTNHIVHDRCVRVKVCDVFARDLEPKHKGQNAHKSVHTDTTERSVQNCRAAQLITAHFVTHFRALPCAPKLFPN